MFSWRENSPESSVFDDFCAYTKMLKSIEHHTWYITINDLQKAIDFYPYRLFILFTFVTRDTSVSRETTQTSPLYDVTVTLLTVMWTWYRTVCTIRSWWRTPCDKTHFYRWCILTSAMLYTRVIQKIHTQCCWRAQKCFKNKI